MLYCIGVNKCSSKFCQGAHEVPFTCHLPYVHHDKFFNIFSDFALRIKIEQEISEAVNADSGLEQIERLFRFGRKTKEATRKIFGRRRRCQNREASANFASHDDWGIYEGGTQHS